MSRRSRAREVVLQLLYRDDLNNDRSLANDEDFVRERLEGDPQLVDFAWDLLRGVRSRRQDVDTALTQVAANWSLGRMAATDRNALRIGAYEILFGNTPDRVAVNEAVELAKRFGTNQSAPFVNGVLDRVMHDRRRAGASSPGSQPGSATSTTETT
ncbi:MAG: transcription antitermination factor NusB [Pirellulaceae bacterium]|nr:transcription antitermination factor NusB [Planctomycetales bacterium]